MMIDDSQDLDKISVDLKIEIRIWNHMNLEGSNFKSTRDLNHLFFHSDYINMYTSSIINITVKIKFNCISI